MKIQVDSPVLARDLYNAMRDHVPVIGTLQDIPLDVMIHDCYEL